MRRAYDEATFRCPQKCNKSRMKLVDLSEHIYKYCDLKLLECPLKGCPELLTKYQIMQHKNTCKFKGSCCDTCGE